jgi:hypothetical protein
LISCKILLGCVVFFLKTLLFRLCKILLSWKLRLLFLSVFLQGACIIVKK